MPDLTTLQDLKARVDAASGPDRRLDAELCCAFHLTGLRPAEPDDFDGKYGYSPGNLKCEHGFLQADSYTRSIDSAVSLTERVLPGWFWRGGHIPVPHWTGSRNVSCWAHISRTDASNCDRRDEATGWCETVPLALISALLAALIAQEQG